MRPNKSEVPICSRIAFRAVVRHVLFVCFVIAITISNAPTVLSEDTEPFTGIPAFKEAWTGTEGLEAFMLFGWYPKYPIKDCVLQVDAERRTDAEGPHPTELLLDAFTAYIVNVDSTIGAISLAGTGKTPMVILTGHCDHRQEIAESFNTYINAIQNYAKFYAFVPVPDVLKPFERRGLSGGEGVSIATLKPKKDAVEAQCDGGLWRQLGQSEVTKDNGPRGRILQALYISYANAIEGTDPAHSISSEITSEERAYILKLVAYQMEHGPCGR
jgi:hypothetical protein